MAKSLGIFDVPTSLDTAKLVYLPVPWEATTSYGSGTSLGPNGIFQASAQVDLFDPDIKNPFEAGLHMLPISETIQGKSNEAQKLVKKIKSGSLSKAETDTSIAKVNTLSAELNRFVYQESKKILSSGKLLSVIGGDHSSPFGAIQAIGEQEKSFGVLHFDAHFDLRDAYQGFTYSHASIMNNVVREIPTLSKLVQVGIRDFSEDEAAFAKTHSNKIKPFYDGLLARWRFEGRSWLEISRKIVSECPDRIWISFDVDGLDPRFCPHTGTPVPGGLDFREAMFLVREIVLSGKTIIGFDLNEVAPSPDDADEWDCNVGARLLYKLSGYTLASQKICPLNSLF